MLIYFFKTIDKVSICTIFVGSNVHLQIKTPGDSTGKIEELYENLYSKKHKNVRPEVNNTSRC